MENKTHDHDFKTNYKLDGIKFNLDRRLLKFDISKSTVTKVCAKIYLINNRLLTTEQYCNSEFKVFIKNYCYKRPLKDSSLYYKLMDDGSESIIILYNDFDKLIASHNFKELAKRVSMFSNFHNVELITNDGYFLNSMNGLLALNYISERLLCIDDSFKLDVKRGGL